MLTISCSLSINLCTIYSGGSAVRILVYDAIMFKNIIISSTILISCVCLEAAEIDHYSLPSQAIPDSAPIVHKKIQNYLQEAIKEANLQGLCREDVLYEKMRLYFNNHTKGQLAKDIIYDESFPSVRMKLGKSVFRDWSVFNGFLLGRDKAKESPLALGPIMRISDHVIGTDKIEHFFGSGFRYFQRHHKKGKDLLKVLKRGVFLEKTILGGNFIATGVFSYGDLAANFNGMRFWNHVLQQDDDVLGRDQNLGPYVSCSEGQWVQVKEINLEDYLDDSFDESRNCSKFATSRGFEKYTSRVEGLETKRNVDFNCLSHTQNNSELLDKYSAKLENGDPISHWIINQNGHEQVSYFNEF